MPSDGYRIKLTDERVRAGRPSLNYTVCVFRWDEAHRTTSDVAVADDAGGWVESAPEWIEGRWLPEGKPISRRQESQHEVSLAEHGVSVFKYGPPRLSDGRLEIPGLVLRWEKVTSVLDQLAAAGISTCSVEQLRSFVQRS